MRLPRLWNLLSSIALLHVAKNIVSAAEAEDYLITTLPGASDLGNITQYAGHIEISAQHNANIFFWLLNSQNVKSSNKLIIWLNGGPGCSSMDGMFLENGPYRVNPDLSLNISVGGWQDHANIVFVDQPVGTGFSFANTDSYVTNMTQVATSFTTFLDLFFQVFPERATNELYIAGESFAGTYIPYIAHQMLQENKKAGETKYDIRGLVIGNGWISPVHQYEASFDFSVRENLLSGQYKDRAKQHLEHCRANLEQRELISIGVCEQILTDTIDASTYMEGDHMYCINQYDIRMTKEPSPACGMTWPHELDDVTKYLTTKEVKQAIHASKQMLGWTECSGGVGRALDGDESRPSYYLLPDILQQVPILLFSGDKDLICNSLGTEYLIGNLTWGGTKGFQNAAPQEWHIGDHLAGYNTTERNLTYVLVKDASHMVPYDKPMEMLDMINRFVGVSDGTVKGVPSWIGEKNKEELDIENPEPSAGPDAPSGGNMTDEESDEEDNKDPWSEYYHWGTSTLVVVILFACIAGFCWYRSSRGGNSRLRLSSRPKFFSKLVGKTGLRGRGMRLKIPQDGDDSNELDELVVETPTLFAAEDYSDDDSGNEQVAGRSTREGSRRQLLPNRSNFSIADDEDE
ncbi:Cell death protease [Umbelopsis nana]